MATTRSWTNQDMSALDGQVRPASGSWSTGRSLLLVWVIDPEKETAVAYRSLTEGRQILRDQSLDGEDVVPGFTCPLAQLFG